MKRNKFIAVFLSVMMMLSLVISANAAGYTADNPTVAGSIAVSGLEADTTATAYQIISYGTSYNNGADFADYSFVNEGYKTVFVSAINNASITTSSSATQILRYISTNLSTNSTFVKGLAAALKDYIKSAVPAVTGTALSSTATTVPAGYYLIDAAKENQAIALTLMEVTTAQTVNLKTSNYTIPSKTVDKATASVGDTLSYTITLTVPDIDDFDKYTLSITDTMSKGQTLTANSLAVTLAGAAVTADHYAVDSHVDATTGVTTLTVDFGNIIADNFATGAALVITYQAAVNEYAAHEVTNNLVALENGHSVTGTGTSVKVYGFEITKINEDEQPLEGVTFKAYQLASDGTKQYLTFTNGVYSGPAASKEAATTLTSSSTGKINVFGLAAGTYYVEEITTLSGYNLLNAPVEIVLGAAADGQTAVAVLPVSIINTTAVTLPSTGGAGTILFTVTGSALLVSAGLFLALNKKRIFG